MANEYNTGPGVNTCVPCNAWCSTCGGAGPNDCNSCPLNYALINASGSSLNGSNGYCMKVCLSATEYWNGNEKNACGTCHAQCSTCNGGANTNCLTCPDKSTLNGGFCGIDCPIGQYNTGQIANTCAACHTDCQTCSGPNSTQGLSCPSAQFLAGGQCVANCPNGTWLNGINCDSCSPCT
jgi:proprotein convertase subtilisin/kexin type 5